MPPVTMSPCSMLLWQLRSTRATCVWMVTIGQAECMCEAAPHSNPESPAHLVLPHAGREDDAVGPRGAVDARVGAARAKDVALVLLARPEGPRVVQQRPQRGPLDAHVRPEQVLTQPVEEDAARRVLAKGDPALVAGCGPRVLIHAAVADLCEWIGVTM